MQLNCSRVRESLHSYIAGDIGNLEKHLIEAHIAECRACRYELDEIRNMKRIIGGCRENIHLPPEFLANVMFKVNKDKYKRRKSSYNIAGLGMSMVCAGVLIFVLNMSTFRLVDEVSFKNVNEGVFRITQRIMGLDGITARIESELNGGEYIELPKP